MTVAQTQGDDNGREVDEFAIYSEQYLNERGDVLRVGEMSKMPEN